MPSDVRPPHVLVSTLHYLIDKVVPQLPKSHPFLWDRTRSIRQDFTYQNSRDAEAIECNELIARVHLLSLHIMLTSDQEYSKQQELEQFNKTLQTLSELYDFNRKRDSSFRSPHEAEFRSYLLLSHINDPDIERQIQLLPQDIFDDRRIQCAITLRGMLQQAHGILQKDVKENAPSLFAALFQAIATGKNVSFLTSCLIESHFQDTRFGALASMARAYHPRGKPYVLSRLTKLLGFSNEDDTASFCKSYGMTVVTDEQQQLAVNVAPSSLNPQTTFANLFAPYIDVKKGSKSWPSCIYNDSLETGSTPAIVIPAQRSSFQTLPTSTISTPSPFASNAPAFSFSQSAPVQPKAPVFKFGTSQANTSPLVKSEPAKETPKSLFFSSVPAKPAEPITSRAPAPTSIPVIAAPPPKPKPVIKYVYSEKDAQLEAQQMMKEVTRTALQSVLPSAWNKVQADRERERQNQRQAMLRSAVTEMEFKTIISALILEATRNAKAVQMDNLRLKKLAVGQVGRAAFISKVLHDQAERRMQEYEMISKQLGRPRKISGQGTLVRLPSFSKERSSLTPKQRYDQKMQEIKREKEKTATFWKPFDLDAIVANPIEAGLRQNYIYGETEVRVACFCQNWESVVGQWLQAKLKLGQWVPSSSKATKVLVEQLQEDPATYRDVCQLILVTGLNAEGQPQSDLTYYREALTAIMGLISERTKFKLDLMVMYWGDDGATEVSVFEQLGVRDHMTSLNNTVFCAMGGQIDDPSLEFQTSLGELSANFRGFYSARGAKEKEQERQRLLAERENREYKAYLETVRQDEAERNRRIEKIQKMNSLHFFEQPVIALSAGAASPTTPKRKRDALPEKLELAAKNVVSPQARGPIVSRGVQELRGLIASVSKRTKTVS